MVTDILIDMEFLSLRYDTAILSLGAVAWDMQAEKFDPEHELYTVPSLSSQTGKVDAGTFAWWMNQADEIRVPLGVEQEMTQETLKTTLEAVSRMVKSYDVKRIWSHGAACDLGILKYWYDHFHMPEPWHYQAVRDTRTLFDFCKPLVVYRSDKDHHALNDARRDAERVYIAYNTLRKHTHGVLI